MTIDIDKLEALAKAATPGPWCAGRWADIEDSNGVDLLAVSIDIPCFNRMNDADFVAAANPVTILTLVAEVRALREDKQRMDYMESRKYKDDRDGGYSGCYVHHVPAYSASTWGGAIQFSHATLRDAIDASRGAK